VLQHLLWLLVGVVLLGVLIFGHTGFTFSVRPKTRLMVCDLLGKELPQL
jgi:membrane protein implicated in regulation of membrane protease activity